MNIIIMGAGKLGFSLARSLIENGHNVTVIDQERERCEKVSNSLDIKVYCDDGSRIETLAALSAGKCDVFIATTSKDEDNLVACEIAKHQFKVKRTVAKSNHHRNIQLMKRLGIDIVVDEVQNITQLIEHEIDSPDVQLIADIGNSKAAINEYQIPFEWSLSGKKVMELEIPEECVLVYLKRNGVFMIPRGNTVIMGGDEIIALTVGAASKKLKKLFEL